jgi:hypothetical protein
MVCDCYVPFALQEYNEGRLVRQQVLSPTDIATISSALCTPADMLSAANTTGTSSRSSSRQQQATALGDVTFKEHSAYDLMVQLQLGVRWVAARCWSLCRCWCWSLWGHVVTWLAYGAIEHMETWLAWSASAPICL